MQQPTVTFEHTYAALGEQFARAVEPERVPAPRTIRVNHELAARLGFDPRWLESADGAAFLTGSKLLPGCEPVATVYAGHQFGGWNPRLGDGRAHLLGELVDRDGVRVDLQLKGSGRTPYSRQGDGKCPLGPALREYVISEAMAALGIPTTRTLGVAATGEPVFRAVALPGGVVARVASSHIRVGTFEYFAASGDRDAVAALAEHALERHYPDVPRSEHAGLDLVRAVSDAQASLIASWQLVGFIHGVMNTDNMLVSGETIDFGPCAFMDEYDPATVFSSIDTYGRYAYRNQPHIAQWNLARLATAVLAALGISDDRIAEAEAIVAGFADTFEANLRAGYARKLGLVQVRETDAQLVDDLLARMHEANADFTLTFRQLSEAAAPDAAPCRAGELPAALDGWVRRWRRRLEEEPASAPHRRAAMERVNPAVIPRNHMVEEALNAATAGDDAPFHALVEVVTRPFEWPDDPRYTQPPAPTERVCATFCGT